jgi:CheY-like chemotaxis protein
MLSQLGHHVIATADGAEVVAAAAREAYAVILTDMRMPKLTGLEVIKTLRSRGDHTPIIVFSSDEDRGVANECIEAGAEAIIRKPVDYEKLLALLDQVAAKR